MFQVDEEILYQQQAYFLNIFNLFFLISKTFFFFPFIQKL